MAFLDEARLVHRYSGGESFPVAPFRSIDRPGKKIKGEEAALNNPSKCEYVHICGEDQHGLQRLRFMADWLLCCVARKLK